jgi:hypothetical protein
MKLFFPDSLWTPDQISGSSFLYFHNEKIGFSLHPSVSSYLSGVNTFSFISFLKEKSPFWKDSFLRFFDTWYKFRDSLQATHDLIEPLRSDSFITIMFSYNRGTHAWKAADELIEASTLDIDNITSLIDLFHACDELYSHLFYEKVLEARYGDMPFEAGAELWKKKAQSVRCPKDLVKDFDWTPIYEYCNELFTSKTLPELLTQAYMFRMPLLKDASAILLSNPNLVTLLSSLPVSGIKDEQSNAKLEADVIAWEFFRQLVSPAVDPLDTSKVKLIMEMIKQRVEEIERLKNKCYELSLNLSDEKNIETLVPRVKDIIRAKVANDLQELLKIDKKAFEKLLTEIFSDEKTWAAVSSFIFGLLTGGEVITAGAAIYELSRVGAKAFKEAANRREKLSTNSYTLIYRMKKR